MDLTTTAPSIKSNASITSSLSCFIAPLNAWGHINACIPIAQVLQSKYNANITFIINHTWKDKLTPFGFNEEIYYNNGIKEDTQKFSMSETTPSKYWTNFVTRLGPIMSLSSFEKISSFGLQSQQQMVTEIQASNSEIEQILSRANPDVIIIDNYVMAPALITQQIPWIRLRSASPLEINPTASIPPANSGYSVSDKSGWDGFAKEQSEVLRPLWNDFRSWFHERTKEKDKDLELPTGQFMLDSPLLNFYIYPIELDYTDLRPMPKNWVRIDALIKQHNKNQSSIAVPQKFLESAKNSNNPLVYISLGTFGSADLQLVQNIVQILNSTNFYCIMAKGPFHDQYELPSSKFWGAQTLPQTEILSLVDIVICHGGNSTINECFYFGKPMIVLPIFGDEYDNAQRIHELGYGVRMNPYNLKEHDLLAAIQTLYKDSEIRNRLRDASKRIQSVDGGAASVAAELIVQHVLEFKKIANINNL